VSSRPGLDMVSSGLVWTWWGGDSLPVPGVEFDSSCAIFLYTVLGIGKRSSLKNWKGQDEEEDPGKDGEKKWKEIFKCWK